MASPTFVQDSRLGRSIFQIRDDSLYISVSKLGGGFDEHLVDLRRLNPDYQPLTFRLNFLLGLIGAFVVLCCLALWGLRQQTLIPEGAMGLIVQWPLLGLAAALILASRYSPRFEGYQFFDHWGKPAVVILRERAQATDCDHFILALVASIEATQSTLSAAERDAVLRQLANADIPSLPVASGFAFWKLSLVFGILAVALPWVPGLAYYFDLFQFMLVFGLCVGGAGFCVFSYNAKEPNRHWSIVGLLLSLIPPFFY